MRGLKRKPKEAAGAHAHQLQLLDLAREGHDTLLIAPTGGDKTLAGFLPSPPSVGGIACSSLYRRHRASL